MAPTEAKNPQETEVKRMQLKVKKNGDGTWDVWAVPTLRRERRSTIYRNLPQEERDRAVELVTAECKQREPA
jgi:hypothetical protein